MVSLQPFQFLIPPHLLGQALQGILDGWGDNFAGSDRYERFQAAVESLESAAEALESVDVSWG